MPRTRRSSGWSAALMVCTLGGTAAAGGLLDPDDWTRRVGVGVGYSETTLDGGVVENFDGSGGVYADFAWRGEPSDRTGPTAEVAVQFTFTREDVAEPGPLVFLGGSEAELITFMLPEVRVGWRQAVGERFFVEPGAGAALLVVSYSADGDAEDVPGGIDDETGIGAGVRPYVRGGYQSDHWSLALEAAYVRGWVDLGDVADDLEAWQVGVVWQFRY